MQLIFKILFIIFIANTDITKAEDFVIIANINQDIISLSPEEISDIFLKRTKRWDDGSKIIPVDLSSDSKMRKSFTEKIHQKKVSNIRAYWQQCLFSGKHSPPLEFKSEKNMLEYIKNNPGAVGYVSSKNDFSGLTKVRIQVNKNE
jgi:ABC-type phosphate transport system substrate-binding protein